MPIQDEQAGEEAEVSYVFWVFFYLQASAKSLAAFSGRSAGTTEAKLLAARGLNQQNH